MTRKHPGSKKKSRPRQTAGELKLSGGISAPSEQRFPMLIRPPGYYSDLQGPSTGTVRNQRLARNAACQCGSGKKYKHCHGGGSVPPVGDNRNFRHDTSRASFSPSRGNNMTSPRRPPTTAIALFWLVVISQLLLLGLGILELIQGPRTVAFLLFLAGLVLFGISFNRVGPRSWRRKGW